MAATFEEIQEALLKQLDNQYTKTQALLKHGELEAYTIAKISLDGVFNNLAVLARIERALEKQLGENVESG